MFVLFVEGVVGWFLSRVLLFSKDFFFLEEILRFLFDSIFVLSLFLGLIVLLCWWVRKFFVK